MKSGKQMYWLFLTMIFLATGCIYAQKSDVKSDTSRIEKKTIYRALAYTSAFYAGSVLVLNNTLYKERASFSPKKK